MRLQGFWLAILVFSIWANASFANTAAPQQEAQAEKDPLCTPEYRPKLSIHLLTKKERGTRIDLFLKGKEVPHKESGVAATLAQCNDIYQALISGEAEVLEPDFVSHGDDDHAYQKGSAYKGELIYDQDIGLLHEQNTKILPDCPNFDISREYTYAPPPFNKKTHRLSNAREKAFVTSDSIRDPDFLKLATEEKERLSKGSFYEATINLEYYNFFKYFDVPVWGYFAEGAFRHHITSLAKEGSELEKRLMPACSAPVRTIQKVLRADTCAVAADALHTYPRTGPSLEWPNGNNGQSSTYRSNLNFHAFIKIGQDIYRLNVRSEPDMQQISSVLNAGFTMALDKVSLSDTGLPEITEACTYSSILK